MRSNFVTIKDRCVRNLNSGKYFLDSLRINMYSTDFLCIIMFRCENKEQNYLAVCSKFSEEFWRFYCQERWKMLQFFQWKKWRSDVMCTLLSASLFPPFLHLYRSTPACLNEDLKVSLWSRLYCFMSIKRKKRKKMTIAFIYSSLELENISGLKLQLTWNFRWHGKFPCLMKII